MGDVVTRYNGEPVEDMNDLPRLVAASKPGESATITVWRDGKEQQLKVTPASCGPSAWHRPRPRKAKRPGAWGLP